MKPTLRLRRAVRSVGTLALALLIAPSGARADFAGMWGTDACTVLVSSASRSTSASTMR